ncbi:sigma-E factor negative regulatory protein RseA [Comamonas sp. BIGb0152]|uniref:sigma-E factor negative regulatory protein n=1 Tax=Comamonas sp. BIGb0152 TaxID=2940601 RepID=UPI00216A76F8|nr:sigma-E factor negative regulatory protein [Comamonas sp. BIGb0152]MCS4292066.1 sigma-E factor negative regulatory protein RseA [Comamonas sp. BIGb0152]
MNLETQASNKSTEVACEQLSAWIDGELDEQTLSQLLAELPDLADDQACYASVQSYQVIGDAMRSAHSPCSDSLAFLDALNARIALEPPLMTQGQPAPGVVAVPAVSTAATAASVAGSAEAANHSVFRWKMVAGFATVAAVAMVGWNSMGLLSGGAGGNAQQQLASAATPQVLASAASTRPAAANAQGFIEQQVTVGQNSTIMLRDPRLDEVLAARGQIGVTANLQMPAGFLRNATFNAEKRTGGCADKASRLC